MKDSRNPEREEKWPWMAAERVWKWNSAGKCKAEGVEEGRAAAGMQAEQ